VDITGDGWTYPILVSAPASYDAATTVVIEQIIAGDPASYDAATTVGISAGATYDAQTTADIAADAAYDAATTVEIESWQLIAEDYEGSTYEDSDVVLGVAYQYRLTDAGGNVYYSEAVMLASASASVDVPTTVGLSADASYDSATTAVISAQAVYDVATGVVLAAQAVYDAETITRLAASGLYDAATVVRITATASNTHRRRYARLDAFAPTRL